MAWTYSGNPSASDRDAVRFLIGDTDTDNQLLSDGEIQFLLAENNEQTYSAAAAGCDVLASKFAGKSDMSKSVGDLSLSTSYGEQASRWREQAETLRARGAITNPVAPTFYSDLNGNVFGPTHFSVGMGDNRR